jgi:hypothetical protein
MQQTAASAEPADGSEQQSSGDVKQTAASSESGGRQQTAASAEPADGSEQQSSGDVKQTAASSESGGRQRRAADGSERRSGRGR